MQHNAFGTRRIIVAILFNILILLAGDARAQNGFAYAHMQLTIQKAGSLYLNSTGTGHHDQRASSPNNVIFDTGRLPVGVFYGVSPNHPAQINDDLYVLEYSFRPRTLNGVNTSFGRLGAGDARQFVVVNVEDNQNLSDWTTTANSHYNRILSNYAVTYWLNTRFANYVAATNDAASRNVNNYQLVINWTEYRRVGTPSLYDTPLNLASNAVPKRGMRLAGNKKEGRKGARLVPRETLASLPRSKSAGQCAHKRRRWQQDGLDFILDELDNTPTADDVPPYPVSLAVTLNNYTPGINAQVGLQCLATLSDGSTKDVSTEVSWSVDQENAVAPGGSVCDVFNSGPANVVASYGTLAASAALTAGTDVSAGRLLVVPTVADQATQQALQQVVSVDQAQAILDGQTIGLAETRQFSALAVDGVGADLTAKVTWSSSDPTVAAVDGNGLVTPVASGTCQITATAGSVTGSNTLTVNPSGKILSPVAVLSNSGGDYAPSYSINNTINHSGLDIPFTNNVTDFDVYTSQGRTHSYFATNEWFPPDGVTSSTIVYDLGKSYTIDRIALWNEDADGVVTLSVDTSDDPTFATSTNVGTFNPRPNLIDADYLPEVLRLTASHARYVRITVGGPKDGAASNQIAIGEIAFSVLP